MSISSDSPIVGERRPTRVRFGILALLAIGTMINYLDRTVLGIATPTLSKNLDLSPIAMGFVFSAFAWTYAAAQIPGGVFLDRFGSKLTYLLSITFWSLFTLLQGEVAPISWTVSGLGGQQLGLHVALVADGRTVVQSGV